jgi:hypothetical protein
MTISKSFIQAYKHNRANQMASYGPDDVYIDGKHAGGYSAAGIAIGLHASAAYWAVRRHNHFMETLKTNIAASNKRSRAARKGWKKRSEKNDQS